MQNASSKYFDGRQPGYFVHFNNLCECRILAINHCDFCLVVYLETTRSVIQQSSSCVGAAIFFL